MDSECTSAHCIYTTTKPLTYEEARTLQTTSTINRDIADRMIEILDVLWDEALQKITEPLAQTAADWIMCELDDPIPEVPLLFAFLGTSDMCDGVKILEVFENIIKKNLPDIQIVRLKDSFCITTVEILLTILSKEFNFCRTAKNNVVPTPVELLMHIHNNSDIRKLIFIVDDIDSLHTSVLHVLIYLCRNLRSPDIPIPYEKNHFHIPKISAALVFGLRLSTIESVRSAWPPFMMSSTLSTGARLSNFHAILEEFTALIAQELRLASAVTLPHDFLHIAKEEAKQCYFSIEAIKRKLQLFIITTVSLIPCAPVFPLFCIQNRSNHSKEEKNFNTQKLPGCITITIKSRNPQKRNIKTSELYSTIQTIYNCIVSSVCDNDNESSSESESDVSKKYRFNEDDAVQALTHRFIQRLLLALLARMQYAVRNNNPNTAALSSVLKSKWIKLCNDVNIDIILTDLACMSKNKSSYWEQLPNFIKQLNEEEESSVKSTTDTNKGICMQTWENLENCLKAIAMELNTLSSNFIKQHFLPQSSLDRTKMLIFQILNPTPIDAIMFCALHPTRQKSLLVPPSDQQPDFFTDIAFLLHLSRISPNKIRLQQWFVSFVNDACFRKNKTVNCNSMQCLEKRFLRATQAMVFLGVITEPKKSSGNKDDKSAEESENEGSHENDINSHIKKSQIKRFNQMSIYKNLSYLNCRLLLV